MSAITVAVTVSAPIETVWKHWNLPESVMVWNHASEDWHCPKAAVDLRVGGKFTATMAAKDGSFSFDFEGAYLEILPLKKIVYQIPDGRRVEVSFEKTVSGVKVSETFDLENENSAELQRQGWQAILENFKSFVETAG